MTLLLLALLAACTGPGSHSKEVHTGDSGESAGETGETGTPGDTDGDGYAPADGDCDDADPSIHPGAAEDPATEGDDNCDGTALAAVWDLDDSAERWDGEAAGQLAGRSVAVGAAAAGGGFLVGATAGAESEDGGDGRGAAFLFGGDLGAPVAAFRDRTGLFAEAGAAVILPGDLDGDGAPDSVLSSPSATAGDGLAADGGRGLPRRRRGRTPVRRGGDDAVGRPRRGRPGGPGARRPDGPFVRDDAARGRVRLDEPAGGDHEHLVGGAGALR